MTMGRRFLMKKITAILCILFAFAIVAAEPLTFSYYQEFDRNGNITYEKYAYGYETIAEYNRDGKQTYYKSIADGQTISEAWVSYHENGKMKTCRLIDYDEEYYYEFDKNGNERYIKGPDGISYRYFYDNDGNNMYAFSSDGEKAFFAYTDDAVYAKYTYDGEITFYTFDPLSFDMISEYKVNGPLIPYNAPVNPYDDYDYDYGYDDYDELDDDLGNYNDYDYNYDDYSSYDSYYDYLNEDDNDYYQETDRHGNITFVKTSYYSEKYEYTYYSDGSIKSVRCFEGE